MKFINQHSIKEEMIIQYFIQIYHLINQMFLFQHFSFKLLNVIHSYLVNNFRKSLFVIVLVRIFVNI